LFNSVVKEIFKSLNICQSYERMYGDMFLTRSVDKRIIFRSAVEIIMRRKRSSKCRPLTSHSYFRF